MTGSERDVKKIHKASIIREKLAQGEASPFQTYRDLTVGKESFSHFVRYEIITSLLGSFPGAAGYLLRKIFYKNLFKHIGKGLIIGRNVVIRHPGKISIGDNVAIDDNCILDGRGSGKRGLRLEDNVLINRNCMILAKTGPIRIGKRSSIGSNSVIVSMSGVDIGEAVLTAGGCYISAGTYQFEALDMPVMDQDVYSSGPVTIGANSWLGTRVTILDGVSIGNGAVIGAGALVNKDIPTHAVAIGTPAKVVRMREKKK
ncbi:MAG: DapH/DapD/GlmU-related protein [Thermodesulfobacteriota bacterium]|nr:DapH/DapD/GlmU-related protein [Thermodesulfobacteriota bacterium]